MLKRGTKKRGLVWTSIEYISWILKFGCTTGLPWADLNHQVERTIPHLPLTLILQKTHLSHHIFLTLSIPSRNLKYLTSITKTNDTALATKGLCQSGNRLHKQLLNLIISSLLLGGETLQHQTKLRVLLYTSQKMAHPPHDNRQYPPPPPPGMIPVHPSMYAAHPGQYGRPLAQPGATMVPAPPPQPQSHIDAKGRRYM